MVSLWRLHQTLKRLPADLLVLGNSNCIGPHSFVGRIADERRLVVRNLSVGASSSATGLYMLDAIPPGNAGLAILDYVINDHGAANLIWGEERARQLIPQYLKGIAARLWASGYFPLVTIFPARPSRAAPLLGAVIEEEAARANGLPILNLGQLFRRAIAQGAAEASLMRDEWHISPAAHGALTQFVGKLIARLKRAQPSASLTSMRVVETRNLRSEALFPEAALVSRKSALRSETYGQLLDGGEVRVALASGERLAGIAINAGASGGTVEIASEDATVIKRLRYNWSANGPQYFSILTDIGQPVTGAVAIRLTGDDAEPTEATLHAVAAPAYGPRCVEIEGLLIVGAEREEIAVPRSHADLPADLASLKESEELVADLVDLGKARR